MRTSRWKLSVYAAIVLCGIVALLPNFLTSSQRAALPDWAASNHVTLGLDLQGGTHLVLEVDAAGLKAGRLENLLGDARTRLREAGIQPRSVRMVGDAVAVTASTAQERDRSFAALRSLSTTVGATALAAGTPEIDFQRTGDDTVVLRLTEAGLKQRADAAIEQSLEIVRRRVDQAGVAEPTIQRIGGDRILVQLPGLQDPTRLRQLLGSTAQMTFHMLAGDQQARANIPPTARLLPATDGNGHYVVMKRAAMSGDRLTDASAGFDQRTGEPIVSFRFDGAGARQFAQITRANVGQPFAIVLDGKVLSAPVIREPIIGGSGQISGKFTVQDTVVLAALLRAGALPAPLTVIEERSVGPDLGSDAIRMGIVTGLAGFALVVGFMIALYRSWGLIANLALALNVALTFGALSVLGATLTLPGIAGIILGIGLAVDANILINERIREETRKGASALKALDVGFRRAYSTIVDANVTTLIATTLLFLFGSGPVRGFAVTMMLGIVISMFTAVAIVRVIMTEIVYKRRLKTLEIPSLFRLSPGATAISFMKGRFIGVGLSIFLSLASVWLFVQPGLRADPESC